MPACADMAVASFEELCAGFCEIAGVSTPSLVGDAKGVIAFHVTWRDVTVDLIHCAKKCADHAFVLFEFGPCSQDDVSPSSSLQDLLHANFLQLQAHPPVFSRNPATGDVLLQYVYPLFDASPNGLFDLIDKGVAMALRWRQGNAVQEPRQKAHAALGHAPSMLNSFA